MHRLDEALGSLGRTPRVLDGLLRGVPESLALRDEGADTWSAFDVVGHLVHGERTDWIVRMRTILEHGEGRVFEPFDRFAQLEASRGKSLDELLDEFAAARSVSLTALEAFGLSAADLERTGTHPELGRVTLGELLATWVVHDHVHLAQIARVFAKALGEGVGPWRAYLPILTR